ncbi:hypothetical protein A7U60_g7609 [Sanghuangporus baumii]|uniref:Uncharacterized protein n=1 Tax=Sanghuangporus baumii TaxID=108892 RepID=A0A9Q5HSY9_SANBA|nr:hypothetical protein A7U60_g7609 [Sanghuangporus baumii]
MDSNADAQAPDMLEKQETASESNGSRREMLAWLVALFVSNITGSTSSLLMNFIVSGSCLHFLVEALGEERVTLASIVFAMIVSSYKTYLGGVVVIFFLYISIITLGGGIFLLTVMRRFRAARQDNIGTKAFIMATLILRQLLDNGIIPADAGFSTSSLHDVHEVLFEASFVLSIMSLWLQSIGIRLLNPIHCTPDVRCDGASVVAFILYWSGAAFLVGYAVITMIISSPGTPVFAKLACMVYGAHTMIALFG